MSSPNPAARAIVRRSSLDLLQLRDPDPVQLVGREVEAGVALDLRGVARLPVGQRAQPRHLAGRRAVGAQGIEVAGVGRPDVAFHRLDEAGAVRLVGQGRDRHDRRGGSRRREQALELIDDAIGDDPSRREARRAAFRQQVDHGVGHRRVGPEAGQEPLEPRRGVGLLQLDQLGEERLVALLLHRGDQVVAEIVLGDLVIGNEGEQIPRDPLLLVERGRVDRQGTRARLLGQRPPGEPARRARVVEPVVVALVPVHRGQGGVELQRPLPGAGAEVGKDRGSGHVRRVPAAPNRCRARHASKRGSWSGWSATGSRPRYGSRSPRDADRPGREPVAGRRSAARASCRRPWPRAPPGSARACAGAAPPAPARGRGSGRSARPGDAAPAAEDRLAEHRGPLDLEEEREARPHVPAAVHLVERIRARAAQEAERRVALVGEQPRGEQLVAGPPPLLARGDVGVDAQAVPQVGEEADGRRVLVGTGLQIVAGNEPPLAWAGLPVAGKAGVHEPRVGGIGAERTAPRGGRARPPRARRPRCPGG